MAVETEAPDNDQEAPTEPPRLKPLSAYLWRPWYARLWWAGIPIYWVGAAVSSRVPLLADFYDLALAGYLNVLFFPLTTLIVLGVRYAREWFGPIDWTGASDPDDQFFCLPDWDRGPGGLPYCADPLDPRSGPLWIGFNHPPTSR